MKERNYASKYECKHGEMTVLLNKGVFFDDIWMNKICKSAGYKVELNESNKDNKTLYMSDGSVYRLDIFMNLASIVQITTKKNFENHIDTIISYIIDTIKEIGVKKVNKIGFKVGIYHFSHLSLKHPLLSQGANYDVEETFAGEELNGNFTERIINLKFDENFVPIKPKRVPLIRRRPDSLNTIHIQPSQSPYCNYPQPQQYPNNYPQPYQHNTFPNHSQPLQNNVGRNFSFNPPISNYRSFNFKTPENPSNKDFTFGSNKGFTFGSNTDSKPNTNPSPSKGFIFEPATEKEPKNDKPFTFGSTIFDKNFSYDDKNDKDYVPNEDNGLSSLFG